MPIVKEVLTDFGVPACYWRVALLQEDITRKTLDVTLQGFFDEAACLGGKQPMAVWRGRIEGELYQQTPPLAEVYIALTKLPDWADARSD